MENFLPIWRLFEIYELTDAMYQQGDSKIIYNFNLFRTTGLNRNYLNLLESRIVSADDKKFPKIFLHILQLENVAASAHDLNVLDATADVTYTTLSNYLEM